MKANRAFLLILASFVSLATAGALTCAAARADESVAEQFDGKLHAVVTPYVWVPTLNGQLRYNVSDVSGFVPDRLQQDHTFDTNVGPNSYLSKLNFAFMFNAELRKGNYALVTDFINVNANDQSSSITALSGPRNGFDFNVYGNANTHLASTIWTIAPAGTVYHEGGTNVNVLLGARFLWLKSTTGFDLHGTNDYFPLSGSATKSDSLGNIIWGTYGQFALGRKWGVPFYFDVGTGSPELTWQGLLGARYGQASLTYRYLDYQADNATKSLLLNMRMNGPQFGYTFRF